MGVNDLAYISKLSTDSDMNQHTVSMFKMLDRIDSLLLPKLESGYERFSGAGRTQQDDRSVINGLESSGGRYQLCVLIDNCSDALYNRFGTALRRVSVYVGETHAAIKLGESMVWYLHDGRVDSNVLADGTVGWKLIGDGETSVTLQGNGGRGYLCASFQRVGSG